MASKTIPTSGWVADGTVLSAYSIDAWAGNAPASGATAAATATVTGGAAAFTGLADNMRYVAYDAGSGRFERFSTPAVAPPSAGSGGLAGTGIVYMPAPSGDTTGATDTANFKAALAKLPTVTIFGTPSTQASPSATFRVGTIYLGGAPAYIWTDQAYANISGTPYYFGTTGATTGDVGNIGPFVSVLGPGHNTTVIRYLGNGDCLRAYNTVFPSSDTFDTLTSFQGRFDGFTIDGSLAGAGACGLHVGDTEGVIVGDDLWIGNFTGGSVSSAATASKGIFYDNAVSWTENVKARANLYNNTIGVYFARTTGDLSFMYSSHEYKVYCWPNQYGVMLDNGANFDQGSLVIRGNMLNSTSANTGALLAFGNSDSPNNRISDSRLDLQAETNSGVPGGTNRAYTIYAQSAFYNISRTYGIWNFGNGPWQSTNMNPAFPISHTGYVGGDNTLISMVPGPTFQPWTIEGLLGWSFDYAACASTGVAPNSQNIVAARIPVPKTITITNLLTDVVAAGAGLTAGAQNVGTIYDSAGNLLRQTADQATNWASTGPKEMPLTSAVTVIGGPGVYIWGGVLGAGTTLPQFAKSNSAFTNPRAQLRFARTSNGGNTSPPATSPGFTTSTNALWFGLS